MTSFWLATFDIELPKGDLSLGPILAARTRYLAIEILRRPDDSTDQKGDSSSAASGDRWAVLFSAVNDPVAPTEATCLLGFSNVTRACNTWLDRGFPLVDAEIQVDAGTVSIVSPFFETGAAMLYDMTLLTLSGVDFGTDHVPATGQFALPYRQFFQAPDGAQPDVFTNRRPAVWEPARSDVKVLESSATQLSLVCPSRLPSLAPFANTPLVPRRVWSGGIKLPGKPRDEKLGFVIKPEKKEHAFGIPSFRFEDVEILGFRIDLAKLGKKVSSLEPLIAPLNFHLTTESRAAFSVPDFRYRLATSTLVIELIRYGQMKAKVPKPPMGIDDSQSQHELMVRLLVGRVDDDTAQARAPAVYVPAIFVDNPWSKILGRDAIGYDKRMASFFIGERDSLKRLHPDGRRADAPPRNGNGTQPEPLGSISRIDVSDMVGCGGTPLLDLEYSTNEHIDPLRLQPLDLDLALGRNAVADTRWRQSDFGDEEFRRSFARTAVADSIRSFRGIQVAPVADRGGLEQTWINGTFLLDEEVRAAIPAGVATLTFHRTPADPSAITEASKEAWNFLCGVLSEKETARISLPRGNWYRLRCSMDLTIDDGLNWESPGDARRQPVSGQRS